MAKTPLNQTMSRPILYSYAQEQIAKTPSKWLDEKQEKIQEFLACIPKIKELVKNKIGNLYPKEELDVLKKYELTNQESCFWFTDQDTKDERRSNNDRSIYANFDCKGYGHGYRYGSSKKEPPPRNKAPALGLPPASSFRTGPSGAAHSARV